ncbi:protein sel-1 homolog 3-like [Spea bombifrons]|uniref:protein sel-1 homolog 3-like n=1 Tax=Spea bombifrons TaxID=233779 RepID=UPI00234B7A2C|nr:protein sel-1 homolog 3-like [Spea bombifrons]
MRLRSLGSNGGRALCGWTLLCQLFASHAGFSTQPLLRSSITFLNPPDLLTAGQFLQVHYNCEGIQVVNIEVLASSSTRSLVPIFKKSWVCRPGSAGEERLIRLDLPDRVVYREDYFMRHPINVIDALLRGWISEYPSDTSSADWDSYREAAVRTFHFLRPVPLYSRPQKDHWRTLRWDQELIWRLRKDEIPQCKAEQEVAPLLSFLYACTGESFGVIRSLDPYADHLLERQRQRSVFSPRCTFSTWLYLVDWCPVRFCGVLYHLDHNNEYISPSVLLTDKGYLHVQVNLVSGDAHAFLSPAPVPLHVWCQVQLVLDGHTGNLTVVCGDAVSKMLHRFPEHVLLDDTRGVFILGGSQYVLGMSGFFGPTVYHRDRITPVFKGRPPKLMEDLEFSQWHLTCQSFQKECVARYRRHRSLTAPELTADSCSDVYREYAARYHAVSSGPQCTKSEEPPRPRRAAVARLLRKRGEQKGPASLDTGGLGKSLYTLYMKKVLSPEGLSRIRGSMPMLLQAGCLGYHPALYLASVLHETGFGVRRDQAKALKLKLIAAQKDERLSLMSLGHKHHKGADNYPVDYDLSYAYYSNVARQTMADRVQPDKNQAFVEYIRLTDEDLLKHQTKEDDDLFMWLKFQAKQGVASAQQAVGRMLFWGQQGISSNLEAAVKFYERGALQQKDPVLMYDYGVVLLRGQGVRQNIPKALEFLMKAADLDFVPAINSLGWYYEQYVKDYKKAVEYWERADQLGNPEAPFNLGILHYHGLYPGKAKNNTAAYMYYFKSATRGHIDAAVHLCAFWMYGIPGVVIRQPHDAVVWTKWVSEQNGYLGAVVRRALDAYLEQSWPSALLHYIQAAEAGFEIAQFNAAYVCEQDPVGLVSRHVQTDCAWKYYNLSTHSERPPSYAQIKMGDLFYAPRGRKRRDVAAAVRMYKEAALQEDPQGLYSLGLLVEEGVSLPLSTLHDLGFNSSVSNYTLVIELYRRCRDHEEEDSYVPCSLALLSTHLQYVWTFHGFLLKCSSAAAIVIVSALSLMTILGRLQSGALNLYQSV